MLYLKWQLQVFLRKMLMVSFSCGKIRSLSQTGGIKEIFHHQSGGGAASEESHTELDHILHSWGRESFTYKDECLQKSSTTHTHKIGKGRNNTAVFRQDHWDLQWRLWRFYIQWFHQTPSCHVLPCSTHVPSKSVTTMHLEALNSQ